MTNISLTTLVTTHEANKAKRDKRDEAKLTQAGSEAVGRVQDIVNNDNMTVDDRLNALKNFGSSSSSAPATPAALPAASGPISDRTALERLQTSPHIPSNIKQLLSRVFDEANPMPLEDDGTPTELIRARTELKESQDALARERDENAPGSLARFLKEEREKKSAGTTAKTVSDETIEKLEDARETLNNARQGGALGKKTILEKNEKTDVISALDEVIEKLKPESTS